ncbi:unnamed protein product, partial [Ectocarpus sp. 12 AP-2014]
LTCREFSPTDGLVADGDLCACYLVCVCPHLTLVVVSTKGVLSFVLIFSLCSPFLCSRGGACVCCFVHNNMREQVRTPFFGCARARLLRPEPRPCRSHCVVVCILPLMVV